MHIATWLSPAAQIVSVLPLAAVHTLGNLLTNVSLGHVAVSFTHTIKARRACFNLATCCVITLCSLKTVSRRTEVRLVSAT